MPKRRKYNPTATASTRAVNVATRHMAFERAFKHNGGNQTAAAIEAGYSPKSAKSMGSQLATRLNLISGVRAGERAAFENSYLSTERVLKELERLAFSDVRKLYKEDGTYKDIHTLDDDTAAAVGSIDHDEDGRVGKVRMADKMVALDRAMKHLGLFERDNRQRETNLTIQVGLVTAPPKDK